MPTDPIDALDKATREIDAWRANVRATLAKLARDGQPLHHATARSLLLALSVITTTAQQGATAP